MEKGILWKFMTYLISNALRDLSRPWKLKTWMGELMTVERSKLW